MATSLARSALEVADWRRRVFALYDAVRAEDDPAEAHELWRTERDVLMATHPASPLLPDARRDFAGLPIAAYDPAWRFESPIHDAAPLEFEYETGTDGTVRFERIGVLELPALPGGAASGTLDVWRLTSYGGGIFLPVRDGLAGAPGGSYGGGRYLLDTVKGADLGADAASGTIVIDCNFAYNPSCAYDPAWACPLAPAGDVLEAEIPVGELYAGPA